MSTLGQFWIVNARLDPWINRELSYIDVSDLKLAQHFHVKSMIWLCRSDATPSYFVRIICIRATIMSGVNLPTRNMIDRRTFRLRLYPNDHDRRTIIWRSSSDRSNGNGKRSRSNVRQVIVGWSIVWWLWSIAYDRSLIVRWSSAYL